MTDQALKIAHAITNDYDVRDCDYHELVHESDLAEFLEPLLSPPASPSTPAVAEASYKCESCKDKGYGGYGGIWRHCSCEAGKALEAKQAAASPATTSPASDRDVSAPLAIADNDGVVHDAPAPAADAEGTLSEIKRILSPVMSWSAATKLAKIANLVIAPSPTPSTVAPASEEKCPKCGWFKTHCICFQPEHDATMSRDSSPRVPNGLHGGHGERPGSTVAPASTAATDKELLDWADTEGHYDASYSSLREELADKGQRLPTTVAEWKRDREAKVAELEKQLAASEARVKEFEAAAIAAAEKRHGASGMCCHLRLNNLKRAESAEGRVKELEDALKEQRTRSDNIHRELAASEAKAKKLDKQVDGWQYEYGSLKERLQSAERALAERATDDNGMGGSLSMMNNLKFVSEESPLEAVTKEKDAAYAERDKLVALLSKLFPSTLERHPDSDTSWDNDWRWIVFITLPTGQATWHIHDSELPMFDHLKRHTGAKWDGHTTEEKYARVAKVERATREGELVKAAIEWDEAWRAVADRSWEGKPKAANDRFDAAKQRLRKAVAALSRTSPAPTTQPAPATSQDGMREKIEAINQIWTEYREKPIYDSPQGLLRIGTILDSTPAATATAKDGTPSDAELLEYFNENHWAPPDRSAARCLMRWLRTRAASNPEQGGQRQGQGEVTNG